MPPPISKDFSRTPSHPPQCFFQLSFTNICVSNIFLLNILFLVLVWLIASSMKYKMCYKISVFGIIFYILNKDS